ncbi:MAG: hypothetical protein GY814_08085 [Gammaproteobacteria bacterium]|nr:hypothetical protein [Gammaproteobacteria bacterium]
MTSALRVILQIINYTIFMFLVGYFSIYPQFKHLEDDQAMITLAISHAGERREECRKIPPEELAKLPPNMRTPMDCPRERSPIVVELTLDGKVVISDNVEPPGLYADQGIDIFQSIKIPAGKHLLSLKMNDSVRVEGPTFTHKQDINLEPAQLLVIQFDSENGKFTLN